MQTETLTAADPAADPTVLDTNAEYIAPQYAERQPAVMTSVFRAILLETVKDFFGSIKNFFLRYIRHFVSCFRYLWFPSLRTRPFDRLDFKEHAQQSFELALLVLFAVIFMVKADWIPATSSDLLETYNDDISSMFVEVMMFFMFAVGYLVLAVLSVLGGRLLRLLFKPVVTSRESDILFVYLHNALFSISMILALWARSTTSTHTGDVDHITQIIFGIFLVLCFFATLVWAPRFAWLNGLRGLRLVGFVLTAIIAYTLLFGIGNALITAVLVGL